MLVVIKKDSVKESALSLMRNFGNNIRIERK
jgi:hypothetical protein